MDYTALALTLAAFGVLMIAISYQRHRHARDISAVLHGIAGVILVIGGALLFELSLNLNTYQDAQEAAPLADITINPGRDNSFEITLVRIPDGELQVFNLTGSQWQLNAEVLHWRRFLPWFGFKPQIRLSELISHTTTTPSPNAGRTANPILHTVRYALRHDGGINVWRWGKSQTVPSTGNTSDNANDKAWVITESIASPAVPFDTNQRVQVYLKAGALVIRPIQKRADKTTTKPPMAPVLNDHARQLLRNSELSVSGTPDDSASPQQAE